MRRLIHARWPYPESPEEPEFLAPAGEVWPPEPTSETLRRPGQSYPDFLRAIELVGMGGSMFPAARKLEAPGKIHTMVINGVECEPGTTIDKALLLHAAPAIRAGAEASAEAVGAARIVIAIERNRPFARALRERYPFDLLTMPHGYPGGAERLIVQKLTGHMLPAGIFPGMVGVLVQNTASVRAIGRALIDNIPAVERPLTVAAPIRRIHRDVIVPIGLPVTDVLQLCEVDRDAEMECVILGGLMMGRMAAPDAVITAGTTSIMLMPHARVTTKESHCINCGACHVACPLGLHPIGVVNAIRDGQPPLSRSVAVQVGECFLCGACEAVCPARIPLVHHLKEGKSWQQTG